MYVNFQYITDVTNNTVHMHCNAFFYRMEQNNGEEVISVHRTTYHSEIRIY